MIVKRVLRKQQTAESVFVEYVLDIIRQSFGDLPTLCVFDAMGHGQFSPLLSLRIVFVVSVAGENYFGALFVRAFYVLRDCRQNFFRIRV